LRKFSSKLTTPAILILKFSVSIFLLYFLISRFGSEKILENVRMINPLSFIAAVGLSFLTYYFASLRWRILIPRNIAITRLFAINMIGAFFNSCMPGIIGGDAVRAYYLSKEFKKNGNDLQFPAQHQPALTENVIAIATVFIDRYAGFVALMIIGMIAFPFGITYLHGTPVKCLMPVFFVSFLLISVVIFKFRVGEKLKFLSGFYKHFQTYLLKKDVLIKVFLYSVLIQIISIFSLYILSYGLSLKLSFLSLLIFVPIITFVTLIPISISGLGLREGAFVLLLGTQGVSSDASMTLSIVWFISMLTANLWGLVEYIRYKSEFKGWNI
jgi:uncharacterized protein (TIRG00374 family)